LKEAAVAKKRAVQQVESASMRVTLDVTLQYLVYLPEKYDAEGMPSPLLLFLHGSGERGSFIDSVKRHGPPKLIEQGKKFPFIVVSPQCSEFESWAAPSLAAMLDQIEAKYNVDHAREYVTGLSLGGYGTWKLAIDQPKRFAAIAPVCGWGDTSDVVVLKDVPVWAFHGKKDRVVKYEASESMVRALKKAGGDAKLTGYPEAGHDAWTATYENDELYAWMLNHRRR
jgi:predicted peptidase